MTASAVMKKDYMYAYTGIFFGLFSNFTGYFWRTVKSFFIRIAIASESSLRQ